MDQVQFVKPPYGDFVLLPCTMSRTRWKRWFAITTTMSIYLGAVGKAKIKMNGQGHRMR